MPQRTGAIKRGVDHLPPLPYHQDFTKQAYETVCDGFLVDVDTHTMHLPFARSLQVVHKCSELTTPTAHSSRVPKRNKGQLLLMNVL